MENSPEDFNSLIYDASRLIDEMVIDSIRDAQTLVDKRQSISRTRFVESESFEWQQLKQQKSGFQWPTTEEFHSTEKGVEKISEYIEKEWKELPGAPRPCWVYAVDFLEKKSMPLNDLYIYRVRYSVPTRRQPIPKQSVAIYFTISVMKNKFKKDPVRVSFMFETMRTINYPENFRFRENLLETISLFKEKMRKEIDF